MKFRVEIEATAKAEIGSIYFFLLEVNPPYADRWLLGLHEAIATLREMPMRCRMVRQEEDFGYEVRRLLYEDYKILFRIVDRDVQVVHVRHASL